MIEYIAHCPDIPQFAQLFETTSWNLVYKAQSDELLRALENSWYLLAAYDSGRLVGFGRVVSDQVLHAMIFDLIVLPEYQNRGIGSELLRRIVQHCLAAGIRDIQLFSAHGKREFYEKRGFFARPEDAPGMQYRCRDESQETARDEA